LPFKCNLQRYTAAAHSWMKAAIVVGLYKITIA
jgi:hypothetical protein